MEEFAFDVEKCLEVLNSGGLILYPTDTVWGIGCDATNETAVAKIYKLKKRVETKKMIVLMSSEKEVMDYVTNIDLAVFDYLLTTTRPTTVVHEDVIGLAENILGDDGSVGIRICRDTFCKHLIKRFQKPIVSTSANVSGVVAPCYFSEISNEIISGVDYVVNYRLNDVNYTEPSSVIKWTGNGNVVVIR